MSLFEVLQGSQKSFFLLFRAYFYLFNSVIYFFKSITIEKIKFIEIAEVASIFPKLTYDGKIKIIDLRQDLIILPYFLNFDDIKLASISKVSKILENEDDFFRFVIKVFYFLRDKSSNEKKEIINIIALFLVKYLKIRYEQLKKAQNQSPRFLLWIRVFPFKILNLQTITSNEDLDDVVYIKRWNEIKNISSELYNFLQSLKEQIEKFQ